MSPNGTRSGGRGENIVGVTAGILTSATLAERMSDKVVVTIAVEMQVGGLALDEEGSSATCSRK